MPTADAFVTTDRADRYLSQLSSHLSHSPGGIRAGHRPDGSLVIESGAATCVLTATPTGLRLHADSPAREPLAELQRRLTARIEQIGHRDSLTVHWNPAPPPADHDEPHQPPHHH
jgi:hypothetical protein